MMKLEIDHRANAIIVTAQARNIDAAAEEIQVLVRDPSPMLAASRLGMTVDEVRDLFAAP